MKHIFNFAVFLIAATLALCSPARAETYTRTATPASPTILIPAQATPSSIVRVEVRYHYERAFMAGETSGEALGLVTFNAPGSFQGVQVRSPLGGLLCSGYNAPPPVTLKMRPLGMDTGSSVSDARCAQNTLTNPEEFLGVGDLPFLVTFPSSYGTAYQSGEIGSRQSTTITAEVTVTFEPDPGNASAT